MKKLVSMADMYTGAVSVTPAGWYAAGLVMEDLDRPWLDQIEALFFGEKDFSWGEGQSIDDVFANWPRPEGKTARMPEAWVEAVRSAPRRLMIHDCKEERMLAQAERIYGPCTPSNVTEDPVVAWIERNGKRWTLRCWNGTEPFDVYNSDQPMGRPAVAVHQGEIYCAFVCGGKTMIIRADGSEYARVAGKYPVLAADEQSLVCICEQADQAQGRIDLVVHDLLRGKTCLLSKDELNVHAHAMALNGMIHIAFEARPSWGADHRLAQTTALWVAAWRDGDVTCCEQVPMRRMGFKEFGSDEPQSLHAGYPRLFAQADRLGVAVRHFRADLFRVNTWDVEISMHAQAGWSAFERVTEQPGTPDTGYALFEWQGKLCGLFPTHEECAMCREFLTRTEVVEIDQDRLPTFDPLPGVRTAYQHACSAAGVGAAVRQPLSVPGYTCVTGDIHNHSLYSKCMSSVDGSPDDLARWYMDLLGMQLLCITDHTDRIGYPQFTWVMDTLEELAADQATLLYGIEPSMEPDQDTNYYAATREDVEVLRLTSLYSLRRQHVYESIRCHMKPDAAVAIRHCHGRTRASNGIHSQETVRTYAPDLEWAMEALQLRGNIILGESAQNPEEHFPCNFLNGGAKIGLVGGTDHDTAMVVNHLGYTGFWTEQPGAQGVLEALRNRRTFAASNGHAQIWTECEGQPMGAEVTVEGCVRIQAQVCAARPVRRAALVRDGVLLEWHETEPAEECTIILEDTPQPGQHWYAVAVCCDSVFSESDHLERHARTISMRTPVGMQNRNEHCMVFSSPYFMTVR